MGNIFGGDNRKDIKEGVEIMDKLFGSVNRYMYQIIETIPNPNDRDRRIHELCQAVCKHLQNISGEIALAYLYKKLWDAHGPFYCNKIMEKILKFSHNTDDENPIFEICDLVGKSGKHTFVQNCCYYAGCRARTTQICSGINTCRNHVFICISQAARHAPRHDIPHDVNSAYLALFARLLLYDAGNVDHKNALAAMLRVLAPIFKNPKIVKHLPRCECPCEDRIWTIPKRRLPIQLPITTHPFGSQAPEWQGPSHRFIPYPR